MININFTIADTGIGISDKQLQELFQSYKQADNSTSRKFGGTGLGLTICKQLVELMNGSISVTSKENIGSEFTVHLKFELPEKSHFVNSNNIYSNIEIEDKLKGEPIDNDSNRNTVDKKELSGISILLVEDIIVNQLVAKSVLTQHGALVSTALNGIEALEKINSDEKFDVILMDIQMPDMDGYEATIKIRENPLLSKLPIIAMTANAMTSDIEQCKESGMNDHISKPFDENEVIEKILMQLSTSAC